MYCAMMGSRYYFKGAFGVFLARSAMCACQLYKRSASIVTKVKTSQRIALVEMQVTYKCYASVNMTRVPICLCYISNDVSVACLVRFAC